MTASEIILGEVIDTATVDHPKFGEVVARLYLVAERQPFNAEHYRLDLTMGGKVHSRLVSDLAEGRDRIAQLRAQA